MDNVNPQHKQIFVKNYSSVSNKWEILGVGGFGINKGVHFCLLLQAFFSRSKNTFLLVEWNSSYSGCLPMQQFCLLTNLILGITELWFSKVSNKGGILNVHQNKDGFYEMFSWIKLKWFGSTYKWKMIF